MLRRPPASFGLGSCAAGALNVTPARADLLSTRSRRPVPLEVLNWLALRMFSQGAVLIGIVIVFAAPLSGVSVTSRTWLSLLASAAGETLIPYGALRGLPAAAPSSW